jgi:hypothetical protein
LPGVPNGAYITTIVFEVYNNAGTTTFTCGLYRRANSALTPVTVAENPSVLNSMGSIQTVTVTVNGTIDLGNYEYILAVNMSSTGNMVRLYGVRVNYTMSQVGN